MAEADAAAPPAPIIVKKVTIEAEGHHGGAWKVAYADFVTAMMAFFLLLWLLGATDEDQRKGLADYFTPTLVKMRQKSAGADGMLGGSSITDVDNYPNAQGQTGTQTITIPRAAKGGPMEGGRAEADIVAEKVRDLRKKIQEKLEENSQSAGLVRQVRVMRSPEGIRIDLVDDADFSMFALGTTILTPEARMLLKVMGETLRDEKVPLILRGHTDSLPWRPGIVANNWSLSTGRAEATRQALILNGLPTSRFARIEGVADREPLIASNPADPRNRRISLLLLDGRNAGPRGRSARSSRGRSRKARSVLPEEEKAAVSGASSGSGEQVNEVQTAEMTTASAQSEPAEEAADPVAP